MTEESPTNESSRLEPLSTVWRTLAAPQTLLLCTGLVAVAVALSTLIPQVPLRAVGNTEIWLARQPVILAEGRGFVRALGLYDLYHTFWFRLLLAVTGLVLFVWLVESTDLAWSAILLVRRRRAPPEATGRRRRALATMVAWRRQAHQIYLLFQLPTDRVGTYIQGFLDRRSYRWTEIPYAGRLNLLAIRRGFAMWAQPVVFGGLLSALAGLAIVSIWGWQSADWQPELGASSPIGHGTPYAIRLDSFDLHFDQSRQPTPYRGKISWLENDIPFRGEVVSLGQPASLRGIDVRLVGYMPVVSLRGWDAAGRPVAFQMGSKRPIVPGEVEVTFASPTDQPLVVASSHDLFLTLAYDPTCQTGQPIVRIALLGDGGVNLRELMALHEKGNVAVGNLHIEADVRYRPVLRVDYRPGMHLVIGGLAAATAALLLLWAVEPRLTWFTWVGDGQGGTAVQVWAKHSADGRQLANQLRREMIDGG